MPNATTTITHSITHTVTHTTTHTVTHATHTTHTVINVMSRTPVHTVTHTVARTTAHVVHRVAGGMPLPSWVGSLQNVMVYIAVGLLIGLIVGFLIARARYVIFNVLGKRFRGKDAIATVFDVENMKFDIVGLNRVGMNTYVSADPYTPMILFKGTDAVPLSCKFFRKPVYVAFVSGVYGIMVHPELLYKLGLAQIALKGETINLTEPTVYSVEELLLGLLNLTGEYMGYIDVNPDLKIGVKVSVPEVAMGIVGLASAGVSASVYGVLDQLQESDRFQKIVEAWRKFKKSAEGRWIIWLLIIMLGVSSVLILLRNMGLLGGH